MHIQLHHLPTGRLVIEIDDQCGKCNHTHPTYQSQWDEVITQTSAWLAKNNPVCRDFAGILPWARGDSPASKLPCWSTINNPVQRRPPAASAGANGREARPSSSALTDATAMDGRLSSSVSTSPEGAPATGSTPAPTTLVMRQPKPIRSVFGCTTCKKRKVKCDETRPRCGNCTRKSTRECVYLYDLAPAPAPTPPPASAHRASSGTSVPPFPPPNAQPTMPTPPPMLRPPQDLPPGPPITTVPSIVAGFTPAPSVPPPPFVPPGAGGMPGNGTIVPSGAAVPNRPPAPSMSVAGPNKLIPSPPLPNSNGTPLPVPNGGSLSARNSRPRSCSSSRESERLRTTAPTLSGITISTLPPSDVRPTPETIARYLEAHGMTWFIEASEVIDSDKYSSQQKRSSSERRQGILAYCWDIYLGYQGKLPLDLEEVPDMGSLVNAGLLYAFVSAGAMSYAYWSKVRRMPSDEHYAGAFAFGRLAVEAARRIVYRATKDRYLERELESKLFMIITLFMTYAAPAADKLGWDALRLMGQFGQMYDGMDRLVHHLDEQQVTAASTVDVISGITVDLAQSLLQGNELIMGPAHHFEWLDEHPLAHRVIPEGFGYSLTMARLGFEVSGLTVSVLYGCYASDTISSPLKVLYRKLTDVLITIYSSPQHPRVQTGDLLIRQCLFCLIFLDGFHLRPDDAQIKRASDTILELFSEALCNGTYTVRWLLPMLVGGSLCAPDRRQAVLDIYSSMASTCGCDDIGIARQVTETVWKRRDEGRDDWHWRNVFRDVEETDIVYI